MDSLTLRIATSSDAKTVAKLHIENWRSEYRGVMPDWYLDCSIFEERKNLWESRLSAIKNEQQHVVIAELSGKTAGFACALFDKEPDLGVCLDNLHVLPHFRRSGIGRALFSEVAQWVVKTKHDCPIHLWVFESNSNARGFYDSLDGKIITIRKREVLKGVVVSTCLYLWKDLNALLYKLCGNAYTGH